jgi:hypothetical protein
VTRTPGRTGTGKGTIYRGSATSYRDKGLKIGKEYVYTVTGVRRRGKHRLGDGPDFCEGTASQRTARCSGAGPPLLVWTPVAKARYYNVQLVHGKKVLSVWPRHPYFRLPRSWVFQGASTG